MNNRLKDIYTTISKINSIVLENDFKKNILLENKETLTLNKKTINEYPEEYGKIEDYNEIITEIENKIKNEIEKLEKLEKLKK